MICYNILQGADFVEIDVHLSRDKVPVIWHDFNVSILLRKKQRGQHRIHHIPVKELTFSHLQDLKVDYARTDLLSDHQSDDAVHELNTTNPGNELVTPFPSLQQALALVDEDLGFFIELKYPQDMFDGTTEEGIVSYFERNDFLDPILKVIFESASNRRIILASFDPDICIMARLKQNKYPVMMLVMDNGGDNPYWQDIRTHHVNTAIDLAKSAKFLGLGINSSCVLSVRREENLLEKALSDHMILFVWGNENNNEETRAELKSRGVHGVCYDNIINKKGKNVFRAEHEEKLRKLISDLSVSLEASSSPNQSNPDSGPITAGSDSVTSISPDDTGHDKTPHHLISHKTQASSHTAYDIGARQSQTENGTPIKGSNTPPNSAQSSPELGASARAKKSNTTQTTQSAAGPFKPPLKVHHHHNNHQGGPVTNGSTSRPVNNVKMPKLVNEDELSEFY